MSYSYFDLDVAAQIGSTISGANVKINRNSASAFIIEQTGVFSDVFRVDTATAAVGINQAPVGGSGGNELGITGGSKVYGIQMTRSVTAPLGLPPVAFKGTDTYTQNESFASPGAVIFYFALNDNRANSAGGIGDIKTVFYIQSKQPSTGTFSSTNTAPGLTIMALSHNETSSSTYSATTATYTTTWIGSNTAAGASVFAYNHTGTGTFTHNHRFADSNFNFSGVATSGTYVLNCFGFSCRGTGTTLGTSHYVAFYNSLAGFDINWGFVNESTANISLGKDAVKIYRGTGTGTIALRTLAPDVYDSYDGTSWLFEHEIVAAGAAFKFNSLLGDVDFLVGGDSLSHLFFLDAAAATENAAFFAAAAPNWQTMDRGFFIGDVSTAPTGNPASGGFLYVEAGALKYRGSGGTTSTVAVA